MVVKRKEVACYHKSPARRVRMHCWQKNMSCDPAFEAHMHTCLPVCGCESHSALAEQRRVVNSVHAVDSTISGKLSRAVRESLDVRELCLAGQNSQRDRVVVEIFYQC